MDNVVEESKSLKGIDTKVEEYKSLKDIDTKETGFQMQQYIGGKNPFTCFNEIT